jgi:hypothetical protein
MIKLRIERTPYHDGSMGLMVQDLDTGNLVFRRLDPSESVHQATEVAIAELQARRYTLP